MKKFLLQTFQGVTGEASAKRATASYFTLVLITSLQGAYIYYMFKYQTLQYFSYVYFGNLLFVALVLGLATIETITALINSIKGYAKPNNSNSSNDSAGNISGNNSTQEQQN